MKKLNIILALMISSFFLLSSSVSADVITYEVQEEHMEYVRTDEFKLLREKVIEYCNENSLSYKIYINSDGILEAVIFPIKSSLPLERLANNSYYFNLSLSGAKKYKIYNGELNNTGSMSNSRFNFITLNSELNYGEFLDTNIERHYYYSNVEFIIKYNDLSYNIIQNSTVPTLYEIYLDYEKQIDVPEELDPKAEIVTNFYILIIDKIKLLTDYIATDYIILSALVIFIFVAVIGLVRRLK